MRLAVLMGGTSEERRVSLATGRAVVEALRSRGHTVHAVDTARGYVPLDEEAHIWGSGVGPAPPDDRELAEVRKGSLSVAVVELPVVREADVVFLAMHGRDGEDGRLQAVLDLAGVRYTGSGHLGSALAFDKRISKELIERAGVPTPAWAPAGLAAAEVPERLGLPVVVKPANGGSTVGLTVVRDPAELPAAFALAARYDADVLFESYIPGRELTVTVLDGEALPVIEVIPDHDIYDYECKYTPGRSRYLVPAELEDGEAERIRELALAVHRVLRQGSYSRVDFRRDSRDGTLYCLEGNSLPGMTATSLVPKAAAAAGIAFPVLCERIARAAVGSV